MQQRSHLSVCTAIGSVIGCVLLCCAASVHSHEQKQPKDYYLAHLESPERAAWQKPNEVVAALGLKGDETVVDLGAGSGYFSVLLSKAVGPTGKVYALDVDDELLAYLQTRVDTEKLSNVVVHKVPADDPQLAEQSVDVIFLCNTYHHLSPRVAYLKKLVPALKPGGRIVVVDYQKQPDLPVGAPLEDRVARETVIEEMRDAGFALMQAHTFLPYQYFLVLQPTPGYTIPALAADVTAVVHTQHSDEATMQAIAPLLERFLREGRLEERFRRVQSGIDMTTYLLYVAPDETFFIAALVIRPGAGTPVHDHQTWTVWGTYQGRDKETPFTLGAEGADAFPELQPLSARTLPDAGLVFTPRPPHDIHKVENIGDTVSVSIHIHGADMRTLARHRYDLRKRVIIPFIQSYEEGSQ